MIVDDARFDYLDVNNGGPRRAPILGFVLHIAVADWTVPQARAYFAVPRPANPVSCTFYVAYDGTWAQFLPTDVVAYTQANGNANYTSAETAGVGDDPWTDEQLTTLAYLAARQSREHGWELRTMTAPGQEGIGYHAIGGAAWGGHPCPLPQRIAQIPEIVRRARIIADPGSLPSGPLTPTPAPIPEDEDTMFEFTLKPGETRTLALPDKRVDTIRAVFSGPVVDRQIGLTAGQDVMHHHPLGVEGLGATVVHAGQVETYTLHKGATDYVLYVANNVDATPGDLHVTLFKA